MATERQSRTRAALVAGAAVLALLANLAGLLAGVTVVLPHLLYIPIALAAYWYPRRGLLIATGIAATYAAMALAFTPSEWLSAAARTVTMIAIAALISYLSRRLAIEERRYHGIFDHSVAGMLVVDGGGLVRSGNPRAAGLVGRAPGELEDVPLGDLVRDRDAARLLAAAVRPVEEVSLDLLRRDGRPVHCLASAAPLGNGMTLVTLADVTGQYLARSALESANRTMATLARILDQDLSADLEALDSLLDRERAAGDDPETVALIRQISGQVDAIARRITVAREFNALGTRPPAWQSLALAVEEAERQLDPGPVAVRPWVARLEVYADPALPSALYHLLHNATRPAIRASTVVVTYHRAPDGCRVYIEDDGVGFPVSERSVLSSRGDGRDRHGLSFVREALGITGIRITEEGAGSGARFVLTVPLEECRVV